MRALRPYQVQTVEAVLREWETKRSTLAVLATGCGKTFTAAEICRQRLGHGRTLWVAHRTELITQARDALAAHMPDVRIGIEKADVYANTHSLSEMHDQIVVASVQTLHEKRRHRFRSDLYGTIVVDEAHHSAAKSYRDILDHFPNAKVLGLTATPDRSDGVGLAGIFDSIAHAYTMEDAIQAGYLTPIRIRAVMIDSIDLSHVKTTAGDLNNAQLAEVMERFEAIHGVAISVAENIGRRSAIVFCASVKQSKDLCEVLAGYLAPRRAQVRHIDGTTPEETRKRILAEYAAGEVQVICNCAVLTEGFDAPCTSMIVLARPTKSRALYTQMVGRGTRLFPGKEDCLIYDYKGNAGRHDLAGPLDLIGKDLPDDVRSILEKMQRDGKVLDDEAIEQAKRERAEQLAEQDRKRKEMAAIRAKARYTVTSIQAFNREFTPSQRASHDPVPMSDKQRSVIVGFGMEIKKALTRAEASELIDKLVKRRERGLCTYKQALKLGENGLRTDLTFAQAKEAMDAIVANRWSAPQWLRAKYGAPAMEATL